MKFDFIQVNKSILDYSEYVKKVILLKSYLKMRLSEEVLTNEFSVEKNESDSYDKAELVFYNEECDLEVSVNIKKRSKEVFV